MDYQTTLNKTKETWSTYRECLLKYGPNNYTTVDAREHFEQKLLDLIPLYVDNCFRENKPFYIQDVAREISSEEQCGRTAIVHYMNRCMTQTKCEHKSASSYELLLESGAWEQFDGEPLERAQIDGTNVLRSKRFKNVIFSYRVEGNDVSWIPRLAEPNRKTSEMAGIFLASASPSISNKSSKKLGIVDRIRISRKPYEIVYIEKHIIPLFTCIFNVPTGFFKYGIKKRKTTYSEPCYLKLDINSPMVGSYCQSVLGVFEIINAIPRKRKPCILTKDDTRSLLRAFIDCNGRFYKYAITLIGDEFFLNMANERAEEIGIKTSRIKPLFDKKYKLKFEKKEGNQAVFKINERQAPVGRRVYLRSGDHYEKIGTVIAHIKGERWRIEKRPDKIIVEVPQNFEPRGEFYQESKHIMYLIGGKKVVEKIIEEIQPKNPIKLLQFLNEEMKIFDTHSLELQELVYDVWDGDLNRLKEKLKKEVLSNRKPIILTGIEID